ncbi:MAG TPA: hypothetical protein VHK01_11270 [Lacipirellulaceae bacterium]|jgi:hypothetical protein|nr:hypothetical protein [Lacipirellulaceae bacterium]
MKCKLMMVTAAIAMGIVSVLCAGSALAVPYQWTAGQIQGLADVTAAFHSGGAPQLSTINSITPVSNGVDLDVTFRVGQDTDPFGANYGRTFARVSLSGGLGSGLNLSGFTSSALQVTSATDFTAQSFLQTDFTENGTTINDGDANAGETFSFLFWEHNDGVSTGGPTNVDFDFSSGTEFDGDGTGANTWNGANPKPVQGTDKIRAWGMQLGKFSGVVVGQPINARISLRGPIPEPSSALLAVFAVLGAFGLTRRRV